MDFVVVSSQSSDQSVEYDVEVMDVVDVVRDESLDGLELFTDQAWSCIRGAVAWIFA